MEGNAVTTTRGSQILYISVMWIVAGAAAGLHVAESLYCLHLTWVRLNMRPTVVLLWTVNILLAGIFGKLSKWSLRLHDILYILYQRKVAGFVHQRERNKASLAGLS